jgi:hypothetical protein
MAAQFRAEETFPGTRDQIGTACVAALRECRFTVTDWDMVQGWVRARAPFGLRSWGENITVMVRPDGTVEIVSECRRFTREAGSPRSTPAR